ncbi:MAG: MFS transporter, partial [Anaerolineales bacterium]
MESSHLENKFSLRSSTRRAATAGYFGSFIIFGLLSAAIGPTLPGLAQNTGSDLSQISLIFTAQALGYLVGSLSGGRLFDRMPGHRLLSVVLLIMGCMAFLIPLIPNLWLLLAVFLLLGNMQGVIEVFNNTLLVWLYRVRVGPY